MFRSFCYDPVRFDVVLLASTRKLQDVFHSRSLKAITGEKKQGHQIIMSPVINYRQLHFRRFALGKRHETEYVYIYMYLEKIPCYTSPEYKKSSQVLRFWKIWDFVCKILCKSNNKKDVHVRISSAPPTKKQRKTVSLSIHPSINQTYV